jgi:hypothetical protein
LSATSSSPLGDSDLLIKTDAGVVAEVPIQYSEDRRTLSLTLKDIRSATTISLVPRDAEGISAQASYRYFLGVVLDEPPALEMKLPGIGTAVTPIARIPIEAIVDDDYGVKELVISVNPSGETEGADTKSASLTPALSRDGEAQAELDLRDMVAAGQLAAVAPGGAINVLGEASDHYDLGSPHLTRSEVYRLQIVTPEQLLALMERRELALRARLEQTIDETRNLKDTLDQLRRGGEDEKPDPSDPSDQSDESTRRQQVRRLRIQQSGLQAGKTAQELNGIATSLDDILQEMVNNRVDSVDRQERIGNGVRDPLKQVIQDPLQRLQDQIIELERLVADPQQSLQVAGQAVETADEVLLQLTAVLEKMLDLESYNEILDMVRELIDDQQRLLDDTKQERKKRVLDLFE